MNEGFLNCKSKLSLNTKIRINFKHSFNQSNLIIKMKNKTYKKSEMNNNKFQSFVSDILECKTLNIYRCSRMPFIIEHNISDKLIARYKITNDEVIKNINKFRKFVRLYIKLFNDFSKTSIVINEDNIFKFLKYHQDKIKSFEEFRKLDINSLFENDLIILFDHY